MTNTRQSIIDIQVSINNLNQQKDKLIFDKREIELKHSSIKTEIRTSKRMPDHEYNKLCREQDSLRKDLMLLERAISEIAVEIMKKTTLQDQLKLDLKGQPNTDIKRDLIKTRDHYIGFASDKTRVASLRAMSAEFAEKLEVLIKSLG